jgi:mono/diheme cytochrome c family protein
MLVFRRRAAAGIAGLAVLLAGCNDMADQPKHKPLSASSFFSDGRASRPLVPGTVARGHLQVDHAFYEGKVDGQLVKKFPLPVDRALLVRGQQRYDIYCAACHDRLGNGQGMVVRRGFPAPPSLHIERLRAAPVGHFYDVITHGFGRMFDSAQQVPPRDRWAITAYIRALQLSQNVPRSRLTPEDLAQLNSPPSSPASQEPPAPPETAP